MVYYLRYTRLYVVQQLELERFQITIQQLKMHKDMHQCISMIQQVGYICLKLAVLPCALPVYLSGQIHAVYISLNYCNLP